VKSERLRTALQNAVQTVRRNLELVRLREVPCEFVPDRLAIQAADHGKLRVLYQGWGFKGMLAELDARGAEQQSELI